MDYFPLLELDEDLLQCCPNEFLENIVVILQDLGNFLPQLPSNGLSHLLHCISTIISGRSNDLSDEAMSIVFLLTEKLQLTNKISCESFDKLAGYLWNFIQECDLESRLIVFCQANLCLQKLCINSNATGGTSLKTRLCHPSSGLKLKECLRILQTTYANDVALCCGLIAYIVLIIETDHCKNEILAPTPFIANTSNLKG